MRSNGFRGGRFGARLGLLLLTAFSVGVPPAEATVSKTSAPGAALILPYLTTTATRSSIAILTNTSPSETIDLRLFWVSGDSLENGASATATCPIRPFETTWMLIEGDGAGGADATIECSNPVLGTTDDLLSISLPGEVGYVFVSVECSLTTLGCDPAAPTRGFSILRGESIVIDFAQGVATSVPAWPLQAEASNDGDHLYRFDGLEYSDLPSDLIWQYLAPDADVAVDMILLTPDRRAGAGPAAARMDGFAYDDDGNSTSGTFQFAGFAVQDPSDFSVFGPGITRTSGGHLTGHVLATPSVFGRTDAHETELPTGNNDGQRRAALVGWTLHGLASGGSIDGGTYPGSGATLAAAAGTARRFRPGAAALVPVGSDVPAFDGSHLFACNDGIDNDFDGKTDFPADLGCLYAAEVSELPECADGIDNDRDAQIDFPADIGCKNAAIFSLENPQCQDGLDNDGDGFTDGADPQCAASPAWWNKENKKQGACGLGFELAPILAGLAFARRRRARAAASLAVVGLVVGLSVPGTARAQVLDPDAPAAMVVTPYLTADATDRITFTSLTNTSNQPITVHMLWIDFASWSGTDFNCPLIPFETTWMIYEELAGGGARATYECSDPGVSTPDPATTNNIFTRFLPEPNGILVATVECQAGTPGCNASQPTLDLDALVAESRVIDFAAGWAMELSGIGIQAGTGSNDGDRYYALDGSEYAQPPADLFGQYIAPDDDVTLEALLFTLDGRVGAPGFVRAGVDLSAFDDDANLTSSSYTFDCGGIADLETVVGPGITRTVGGHRAGHIQLVPRAEIRSDIHELIPPAGDGNGARRPPVLGWLLQTMASAGDFDDSGPTTAAPSAWGRLLEPGTTALTPLGSDVPVLDAQ